MNNIQLTLASKIGGDNWYLSSGIKYPKTFACHCGHIGKIIGISVEGDIYIVGVGGLLISIVVSDKNKEFISSFDQAKSLMKKELKLKNQLANFR